MSGTLVLSTIEDAVQFLEENDLPVGVRLNLEGELSTLEIRIFGPAYHGELHGEIARGIVSFQDEIYRATLETLQELGIDQKRLSSHQKELLELRIEVENNCTLIKFDMGNFAKGLTEVLSAMPPEILAWVVVGAVSVGVAGWAAINLGGRHIARKESKDQLDQQQAVLQAAQQAEIERTRLQAETMQRLVAVLESNAGELKGQAARRYSIATENGVKEIAARATDAVAVQVGNTELDEAALREIRRRAPRTIPEKVDVTESFKIVQFNKAIFPHRIVISGRTLGEIAADFDEAELSKDKVVAFYEAFRSGEQIGLSVSALISGEKVKFATITDVQVQDKT
jgi:hypothetical protein